MEKQVLKDVILDQRQPQLPSLIVEREAFLQNTWLQETKQIVVITGMRRCGKSTLLQMLREREQESDYYITFDDDRLVKFELNDFQMLYELFVELYGEQKTFYFDEIQNIEGWERFVRRLHDQGNKIYITGSNANLFSEELGTRLTGRYFALTLFPYSFREFISLAKLNFSIDKPLTTIQKGLVKKSFAEFLKIGGIPTFALEQQKEYLHSLYESILYRDIIVRYKIINPRIILELAYYLAGSMSKEITYNSLRKMLGVASPSTISDYCYYLQNSYLCYFINRHSHSLKKQIQYAKKVYFNDHALAMNIGFRISKDHGRILENIVFLELLRRKQEVFFHREKNECDFLTRERGKIQAAIQVCMHLDDPITKERELSGLQEAMEMYEVPEGLILTDDTDDEHELLCNKKKKLIKIMPVWKWLSETPLISTKGK